MPSLNTSPLTSLSIDQQIALIARGTVDIVPLPELKTKLLKSAKEGKPLQIKLGLDPTAPDIHLGFAVVLRKLRQFQDLGHEVVIIIGDYTALIGDPSGRSTTRPMLSSAEIEANGRTYVEQLAKVLDREKTIIRFNSEWLGKLSFADLVGLASKMTVAQVLQREDFANRFRDGQPISLHELLYPLAQAYDSVAIHADVEMGGQDQTFNNLAGRALQKELGQEPQVVLLMPLLVGLDGIKKMSKSLGNYVGISEPPAEMFGKLMSLSDELMPMYFELCTDVPMDDVAALTSSAQTHPRDSKKRLAREIITLYHSAEAAQAADDEFERVHKEHQVPDDMPEAVVPAALCDLDGQVRVAALLVAVGLAQSSGEAKRLIQQGGVSADGVKISDPAEMLTVQTGLVIKVGRNRFTRLIAPTGA
ncbi:MAG: tyrosine--tRNA ligase [Janthinobacterium lividum]